MLKRPFVSVVVISHNGEATLRVTLDSLLQQTYPHKSYEIIVVDDGSTDGTAQIAQSYPRVRYIGLKKNRGISEARNAGLRVAKGEIYVSFDDDCIAAHTWLAELIKGYSAGNPAGVGGRLIDPHASNGITNRYISACDSNIAPQMVGSNVPSKNPVRRFLRYLTSRLKEHPPVAEKVQVTELYGANGSFRKSVLKKVGGWRDTMSGIEDRDLSRRISDTYPGRHFYMMPKAIIVHDRGQSLIQYLLRPYKRGPMNLAFHRQNHIAPPVFPFPILYLLVMIGLLRYPLALVLVAILLPHVLYVWWDVKAVRRRDWLMLLFPYLQMTEETMVIAGLVRGYTLLGRAWVRDILLARIGYLHLMLALVLIGTWASTVLMVPSVWWRTVVSLPFLLLLPGYYAWLALRGKAAATEPAIRALGYSAGLSVLIVMVSGLLLNEIYTALGLQHPLSMHPIVCTMCGVTALLALLAFMRLGKEFRLLRWRKPRHVAESILAAAAGTLLPVIAVGGAVTLNNDGPGALALVAIGTPAFLLLVLMFGNKGLRPYFGWFLYSICLSILLGTSMRGWNITGHDVMQEFQVFQLTLTHAAWHMQYYHDAYMACLSITILPTIIQVVTGISAPYVFKFVTQLLIALIAPVLYGIFIDFTTRQRALLATFLFISFPTFLTDLMMLNRQGIAFLFFALSLQAGLDRQLNARHKSVLGFALLTGMILSHYSTSYVALGSILLALGLGVLWRIVPVLWRQVPRPDTTLTAAYHIPVVVASLVVLIAWGTFATQTSNNISQTIQDAAAGIYGKITGGISPSATPVPATVTQYAKVATQSRSLPATDYYSAQTLGAYSLSGSPEIVAPVSRMISHLGIHLGALVKGYTVSRAVYTLLIEGLVVIGLAVAILRKRHFKLPLQWLFIGAGMIAMVILQVVLPAAIDYGLTRLIQQSLVLLALPMVLTSLWIMHLMLIPRRLREGLVAVVLSVFFLVLSGFLPALTGGFKPTLSLSNSGFYYEAYYTHQEEIAAASWLDTSIPVGSRVYSDEFMRRKLITYADIFAQPTLVPAAIPVDSYVVLGYGNLAFNQVPAYVGSELIYYQPPTDFLNSNKNLVYSSDNVAIYK